MAKSKPIGVRFDLDLLQVFKDDKVAETPQAALNYLTEFYRTNRERIDFKEMFENSALFKNAKHTDQKETGTLNKAFKKGFSKKATRLDDSISDNGSAPDPSNKAAYLKWLKSQP